MHAVARVTRVNKKRVDAVARAAPVQSMNQSSKHGAIGFRFRLAWVGMFNLSDGAF